MKKKVIICLLILLIMVAILQTNNFAAFDFSKSIDNFAGADGDSNVTKPIAKVAGIAINVTQLIAVGVAIIMLIVLAMKYMTSAAGDKATIKKHAVVYIVGAVIMFASTGILQLIKKFSGILGQSGK